MLAEWRTEWKERKHWFITINHCLFTCANVSFLYIFFLFLVFHVQGDMLPQNISKGVIISNHSLVLQGVSRTTAGNYSCVGFNSEGDGTSPPFELNVMCKLESVSSTHFIDRPSVRPAAANAACLHSYHIPQLPCLINYSFGFSQMHLLVHQISRAYMELPSRRMPKLNVVSTPTLLR